jgi:predicted DNA-binding transcriptional regulator YafY
MSRQGAIKRFTIIIDKLQRSKYPSAIDILQSLSDGGFEISERSMQRDFSIIRSEFGIDIVYKKSRNGYFIDKDTSINFEAFLRFLEIVNTADLLTKSIRDGKDALNYISFEAEGSLKGLEYLKLILEAIHSRNRISFQYFNFQTKKTRTHVVEPYLLKQYQNRWYVVGKPKGINEWRSFGIERIESLEVQLERFSPDKNANPKDLFAKVVGVNFPEAEREIVRIAVKYPQANYVKTLPFHTSQEIEEDNEKGIVLSLFVIPNFELIQKIMMNVEHAKVLEPKWLADEIKSHLKWMIKNYP